MSDPAPARSPSLEAVRALEERLAERIAKRAEADAALAAARTAADRLREEASRRGEAAAAARRREKLAAADVEAGRIRGEAEVRAAALQEAMTARLDETVAALLALVLPPTGVGA